MFRFSESGGVWLAVFAAVGFSAKAIFVKLAFPYGVSPLTLLALRMLFAAPVFVWVAARASRTGAPLSARDWVALLGLGAVGYYGASYLDFLGLRYISAGLERLVLFTYPTLTFLIGVCVLGRAWSWRDVVALLLAYAGVALALTHDLRAAHDGGAVWLGIGLVFASSVCYAIYLSGSGAMIARLGSQRFSAMALCVSTGVTLAHFGVTAPLSLLVQPWPVLALALAMAVFSTVLPVFWLSAAIRQIGASRTAMIGSLGPVLTIGMGAIFLGEPMSAAQWLGTALVVGGVSFASLPRKAIPVPLKPLEATG